MNNIPSPPSHFFQFSSALMCVLDADGTIIQLNPAWEAKLNVVLTDLEQSHYLQWVHPADYACSQEKLERLFKGQSSLSFSNRWRDCAGYYHWLQWEISSVPKEAINADEKTPLFYAVATDITPQKHAENVLHQTEERFELAVQGSNLGLWDWNLETNDIYFSPRWKNILGYEDHEIHNTPDVWSRFVHPDDLMLMWATVEAYLDQKIHNYEMIYRVLHKDGNLRWVIARAAALWDNEGKPYRMVGTYIDITERKRIEQALQENEALLSAIFDVTKVGLCVTDEAGQFVRVNSTYCELYGYTAEELLGQHFTKLLPLENRAGAIKRHQALLDGDPSVESQGEWQIQNRTGHELEVRFTLAVLTQHNRHRFQVTSLTDMTKRKDLERERNRLFNLSLDMQSVIGFDIAFKEINAAWERTLGWRKAELLERSPMEFVHPEDQAVSIETIQQLITGKTIVGFENRYLCQDGTYKWLSWNVYPLVDQQTLYAVTRDITERKQAQEAIQQQQAFIRLVVDSVPHLIFIKDRQDHFIFVNQAVADFLGKPIDELVNANNPPIQAKPLESLSSEADKEVIQNLNEIAIEETYCNTDGEARCFHLVKKPFKQHDVLVLSVGTDITERKQHESALKQSEARYRAIVEQQMDLVCRYLPNGTLTFVNQAYCRYFDRTEQELLGHLMPYLAQEEQPFFTEKLARLTPSKPSSITEQRVILPNGNIRWQQWIDRAMYDGRGDVIEYQGVGRDITERREAEEALRQSEERLRIITSAAPVILFAIDNQGIFTCLRGQTLSVFGLSNDEALGQSVFEVFAHLPKELEDIRRALAGETVSCLTTLSDVILETKTTPLRDSQEQIIGAIGVSIDISQRYQLELQLKNTVAELETILDNSVIGIAYLKNGVFMHVNRKLEILLCYAKNELCGLPFQTIFSSAQEYQQMEQRAYPRFSLGKEYNAEHSLCTNGGNLFWSRMVGKAVDAHDLDKGSIWIIENITVQKKAEQHLRLTATIFETSGNGIIITDENKIIQRVNPAFSKMTGYSGSEVYGQSTHFLSSGRHNKAFYKTMWENINQTGHWQGEIWNRKKNGALYVAWLSISVISNENGEPAQYMAILTDISSLQEDIEKVRYLANYDSLTGLPNRLLFHDHLLQSKTWATPNKFALLFIDLDGFKSVNDHFGHAIGDLLLQEVAKRLQSSVRETDIVARLGGDEFTLILNNIRKAQDAGKVSNLLIQNLQQPFQLEGNYIMISASIGISLYFDNSQDIDHLIKQADSAMYQAKKAGKGRFCFYQ